MSVVPALCWRDVEHMFQRITNPDQSYNSMTPVSSSSSLGTSLGYTPNHGLSNYTWNQIS